MDLHTLLEHFHAKRTFSDEMLETIQNDDDLRLNLFHHFKKNKDSAFTLALLDQFIAIRQNGHLDLEQLMFACYLVGLHRQVEDSLNIWRAKNADFDTYCGLDIQLIASAGVEETLEFLKNHQADEAQKAFEYVVKCRQSGDFNRLDDYYSEKAFPWFL